MGGRQAVAEAWRNITAVGALPLAITDNMNFGNPTKPEIMGQFAAAVRGIASACIALDFPVVSGNVSLYNETEGRGILPTPAIGGLGVIEDAAQAIGLAASAGQSLVLIGDIAGHLGQSLWLREVAGREEGPPPPVDLARERRNGDFVRSEILAGRVAACHDLADGGLLVTITEMLMGGRIGATLTAPPEGVAPHAWWFGEDQGCYVLAVTDPSGTLATATAHGVPARLLGQTSGQDLKLDDGAAISITGLVAEHERFFPEWMN
jgi:phosphoribosylformylglycinamidine synthase